MPLPEELTMQKSRYPSLLTSLTNRLWAWETSARYVPFVNSPFDSSLKGESPNSSSLNSSALRPLSLSPKTSKTSKTGSSPPCDFEVEVPTDRLPLLLSPESEFKETTLQDVKRESSKAPQIIPFFISLLNNSN